MEREKSVMARVLRNGCWALCAAGITFAAGIALACDGNYCPRIDTHQCVSVDVYSDDSCCITVDSTGQRCWMCTRENFLCMTDDGQDFTEVFGEGYDPHDPGPACN